ncbi:hypothetical protein QCE73_06790 [Caballeronia sp. LZ029]|uniref:hypothetical protein n=1 Tax=Caballeronia sp. LZ029 TaxID=3038564 RepID=UPI0028573B9E|nr:hypothetical protein [Caballeronia sp. LZ029]MDR5742860.1 hypothetical protein [Caballeronia sp. LZ029]
MKLPYFKLGEALTETRDSFSYGEGSQKLSAVARLVGKSAANVGMLAVEAGLEVVKRLPEIAGDAAKRNLDRASHLMTDEQRERAEQMVLAGIEARDKRMQRERDEERRRREESYEKG